MTPTARTAWNRERNNILQRIRRLRNRTVQRRNHQVLERRNEAMLRVHEAVTEQELEDARRDLDAVNTQLLAAQPALRNHPQRRNHARR
ncbi:ATP-dependent helicase [Anopheles sinensis]|uniref:ATP-dependent helicase n=1 Tax=Anopheles sinensis TaxID=74873 RepID=A0A084VNQ0_ANOSI|nr:ATP-dependent helicase [Anopheles sinensis]